MDDPENYSDFPMPLEKLYQEMSNDANRFTAGTSKLADQLFIGQKFEFSMLFSIEKFVIEIISTDHIAYVCDEIANECKVKNSSLAGHLFSLDAYIDEYTNSFVYSPHVELFFSSIMEIGMQYGIPNSAPIAIWPKVYVAQAKNFNKLIETIRHKATLKEFKRHTSDRIRDCRRNFESSKEYVDYLFNDVKSRLLVLRLDLGFKVLSGIGPEKAINLFKRFLNNRRSNLVFDDIVGYIWKLEMGEDKGYHFHIFFFLDGSGAQKDAYRNQQIGKYWEKLTDGLGCFHNVNLVKKRYQDIGIGVGMISHFDSEKRGYLLRILQYFFKKEQYLRVKLKKGGRTYGRGEISDRPKSAAGRPRKELE